ncbi:MAG: xylulokinase, partial [Myxococcota bacterium]
EPLRPAILWNDGRSEAQCLRLESQVPNIFDITGNRIMPGFTAPKLLWVANHEPDIFSATRLIVLPKDYIRYKLTGDFASDMSDAAGTMWLDVGRRDYSDEILSACNLRRDNMPELFEGPQVTGQLRKEWADALGCGRVPVVAGGGDNAAGAIGAGIAEPGQAMMSLGTSGTYFLVTKTFRENAKRAVHSFCHALPERWHVMSVVLSAASCLSWLSSVSGEDNIEKLLSEAERCGTSKDAVFFLPYLSGERTPHNNPQATGMFFGLTHRAERGHLVYAVLEGVAMAMRDGADAVHQVVQRPSSVSVIGGGARSPYWTQLLCDMLEQPLTYSEDAEVGPALGAAYLAMLSQSKSASLRSLIGAPKIHREYQPDPVRSEQLRERIAVFRTLYARIYDARGTQGE